MEDIFAWKYAKQIQWQHKLSNMLCHGISSKILINKGLELLNHLHSDFCKISVRIWVTRLRKKYSTWRKSASDTTEITSVNRYSRVIYELAMPWTRDAFFLRLHVWSCILTGISGSLNFDEEDTEEEEASKRPVSHSPYPESERPSSASSEKSFAVSVLKSICDKHWTHAWF